MSCFRTLLYVEFVAGSYVVRGVGGAVCRAVGEPRGEQDALL